MVLQRRAWEDNSDEEEMVGEESKMLKPHNDADGVKLRTCGFCDVQVHIVPLLIKIINSWHVHIGGVSYYATMNLVFWLHV